MGLNRNWELPRDRLEVTNEKLGSGCFGNVYTGLYTRKDGKEMVVAVKMLKGKNNSYLQIWNLPNKEFRYQIRNFVTK